jgi:predicted MFS family arabinose efflux permease
MAVAIAFAVLEIGDATDLGIVLAASGIPFALFAIAGGVLSDRVGPRRTMIASDVIRTICQAVVAALLLTGSAEIWMLVILSAVYGACAAIFMPALMGLIPRTVPPERLQEANALLGFSRSAANVGGPAVAGIVMAIGNPGDVIAIDALTFAVSAACLLALRPAPARADAGHDADEDFAARLRTGWHEVRARPWLRVGLGAMAAYHVFVLPAVFVLGPALARDELDGASSWAAIVACWGVGTAVGNLVALRVRIRRPVLVAAIALVGASTQGVILGVGLGTAGIAALELLAGVASSLFFTLWDTSIQEQVPPHAISRVSSYDFSVSLGLMPLGMAVAGPVALAVGLHATLVGMGALGMLAGLAWLAVPDVRRVRRGDAAADPVMAPRVARTCASSAARRSRSARSSIPGPPAPGGARGTARPARRRPAATAARPRTSGSRRPRRRGPRGWRGRCRAGRPP